MLDKSIPFFGVIMCKTDTQSYPHCSLPEGYHFSGYQPGFEKEWAKTMYMLDQTDTLTAAEELFHREFFSRPELLPKQCLFVLDDAGTIAATASLWHGEHFGKTLPRIHWVAAAPEHQGKGLCKALLTKLMDTYNELGLGDFVYLTTQTWSYKAINIYRHFGFHAYTGEKPVNWKLDHFDGENQKAWQIIDEKISEYSVRKRSLSL